MSKLTGEKIARLLEDAGYEVLRRRPATRHVSEEAVLAEVARIAGQPVKGDAVDSMAAGQFAMMRQAREECRELAAKANSAGARVRARMQARRHRKPSAPAPAAKGLRR